jgi:hypothetical protein
MVLKKESLNLFVISLNFYIFYEKEGLQKQKQALENQKE